MYAANHAHDEESGHSGSDNEHRPRGGSRLKDADKNCYLGPAESIHAILDVSLYIPVVPLAPLEELHASSVKHPGFCHMRWLPNMPRAPVLQSTVAEEDRPPCAGIGHAEQLAWLCHSRASHLLRTPC